MPQKTKYKGSPFCVAYVGVHSFYTVEDGQGHARKYGLGRIGQTFGMSAGTVLGLFLSLAK